MITFACMCGQKLQVADSFAGKNAKCPKCGQKLPVPRMQPASGAPGIGDATVGYSSPSPASTPDAIATRSSAPSAASGETLGERPVTPVTGDPLSAFLAPAEKPDELGRLGGYRVLKILGHGGMGVVYLAEDAKLHRRVAIKAMLPDVARSTSSQQRFLREAQSAAALEHDHIVPILHVGEDRGVPFIVMPFLKGESLEDRLKRPESTPISLVLQVGRQVASALAAAHARGLIHRDIKPANIWLETKEDGGTIEDEKGLTSAFRVKLLDFGLARLTQAEEGEHLTQAGAILGTPGYMPPEQVNGQDLDGRADLFSLGCVLYRMATGKPAFGGENLTARLLAVTTHNPAPPAQINPEVPAELSKLIMKLLSKDRAQRPASADEIVKALGADVDSAAREIPLATPVSVAAADIPVSASPRRRNRTPIVLAGIGVFAVATILIGAGIVLFWQTRHGTVRIESDDPDVEIVFNRNGPTIKGADKQPITLRAGEHGILVKRGDFSFETDKLLIEKGKTITLKIELLKGKMQLVHEGKVLGAKDLPSQKEAPLIKVDPTKPAEAFGWAWPAEELRAGKIKAPGVLAEKIILEDKLRADSNSGFLRTSWHSEYRDGAQVMRDFGGDWGNSGNIRTPPLAVEMSGRVDGDANRYWGLDLFAPSEDKLNSGLCVSINGHGEFFVDPCQWTSRPDRGPWRGAERHPAIRPMPEKNRLLVLIRGRVVEIFVNDIAVCDPIVLPSDMPQVMPHWRANGGFGETVIDTFRIRTADAIASPEARGAKPIAKPAPVNRELAEKICRLGGHVNVRQNGCERNGIGAANIPEGPVELTAAHMPRIRVADDDLAAFKDLPALRILGLTDTPVTDKGMAYLKGLQSLRVLHLHNTSVTDAGLEHLASLTGMEELILHNTKQVKAVGIRHLRGMKSLRVLSLAYVNLGDAALEHVDCWPELERFYLHKVGVSDDGVARLAGLKKLRTLDLYENLITRRGVKSIAKIASLEFLGLGNCKIDDAALEDLTNLHALRDLWLNGTQVSRPAVEKLARALPQCTIHLDYNGPIVCDGNSRGWWRGGDRRFQFVQRGVWVDVMEGKATRWKEIARTGEHIDLEAGDGKTQLRLLADRMESRKTGDGAFAKLADGHWTSREEWEAKVEAPPADPDRKAAQYVLSIGGTVRINDDGFNIRQLADLPREPFRLIYVHAIRNPRVNNEGLANFKGCKHLTFLDLWEAPVTDDGLANFAECKKLRHLYLGRTGVTDRGLVHFKDCALLRTLHLENTKVTGDGFVHFQNCRFLRTLWLVDSAVTDVGLAHLKNCEQLRLLNLGITKIGDEGLAHFKNCCDLHELQLSTTQVTDAGLAHFRECTDLTDLGLHVSGITDAGLAHLKNCRNLRTAWMRSSKIGDAGLAYLLNNPLRNVSVQESNVTPAGIDAIKKALPRCVINWKEGFYTSPSAFEMDRKAAAQVIALGGSVGINHDREGIRALGELPRESFRLHAIEMENRGRLDDDKMDFLATCPDLTILNLRLAPISGRTLAHVKNCAFLRNLDVHGSTVNNDDLIALRNLKCLDELALHGAKIDDEGLAHLKDLRNLTFLTLWDTQVTGVGLKHLKNCQGLEILYLNGAPVTDQTLAELTHFQGLGFLDLRRTRVTSAGIGELRKSLPYCSILWDGDR